VRLEFSQSTKKARWAHCHDSKGIPHCEYCGGPFDKTNVPEAHHHKRAGDGGDNSFQNCRIIGSRCCHRDDTNEYITARAKSARLAFPPSLKKPSKAWPYKVRGFRKWG
jgi:hypothetical protein